MKPRRLFDLTAPVYRYITWQDVWRDNCAEMAGLFPEVRGARVADLGIGPGVSAIGFLEARPDVRIIGVDLSRNMLREAQAMSALPLVQADATRLPFPDASFDVVAGHSFLYLVPDRRGVLAEARRILRPSGKLVLLEPRADGPWHRGALMSGPLKFRFSMVAWRVASGRYGRFAQAELRDTLLRAGFRRAEVTPTLGRMAWFATATP